MDSPQDSPKRGLMGYSLYVGDLARDVTEALLYDVFKNVGPIQSIRVCRDSLNRQSLQYGYVNFVHRLDAERALANLNFHSVHGRPMRIMWVDKDASKRKLAKGNIIIKSLNKSIDHATLFDTFSQFGSILSCKVETDRDTGESKGYGFVHFEAEESAKQAIAKVDGMMLAGQQVQVQAFIPRGERIEHNKATFTNLEVKGFRPDVTEAALLAVFRPYGAVQRVKLLADRREAPLAFVDYEAHEAAAKAVEECHGRHIAELCAEGETLSVQRSLTKAERKDQQNRQRALRFAQHAENSVGGLYVGNLAEEVDDAALRAAFAPFGDIARVQVMTSQPDRKSRGFGFVCFTTAADAERAKQAMNNTELMGRQIVVNRAQHRQKSNQQGQWGGWEPSSYAPPKPLAPPMPPLPGNMSWFPGAGYGMYPGTVPYFAPPAYLSPAYQTP